MNKLISRNPIQRFKEGRKIVKAQNSWGKDFGTKYIPPVNTTKVPKGWSYSIDLGTANSFNMDNDIVNHDFSPYNPNQILNYPHSGLVADAYNDSQDTQQRSLQIATHNIKKASEPFHRRSYDNSVMDPERSYKAENKRYIANVEQPKQKTRTNNTEQPKQNTQTKKNSQKQNKKSGTSSFSKAFKEARAKGLREFVWNGQKKNTMKAGETREQWLKNLGTKKTSQQKEVVASNQPTMEKVKTQTVAPSSQEIGNWTQALIEAQQPQQTVSSNYIPSSEDVMNWIQSFKYKQGGILPSRNPVKRFKNRNFS